MVKRQIVLYLAVLCLPFLVFSQEGVTGSIQWTTGLSWNQVKAKAKKENKYIFVDCYATWCKPCKEMDKKVYSVDSVGDYLNAGFISVKLQMDVTKKDDATIQSWYKTAKDLGSKYRISSYPSYLFFAPSGEVVSKETGYKNPGAFIQVARNATDPSKQYFVLLRKYKQGKLDHASTASLIQMAQQIGDTADYRQLLKSYYAYLHKQKKEKLYTKENIEFVASTLDRSNMVLFDMFYPNGEQVNKVMQSGWYSKKIVDKIINTEKVQPFINNAKGIIEPDWDGLYRSIAKDYGDDYAGRNVLDAKKDWCISKGDMLGFARGLNGKLEKYGSDTTNLGDDFVLNTYAYIIFESLGPTPKPGEDEIKELNRVCRWMNGVVRRGEKATGDYVMHWPLYLDTYANLLYKIGQTSVAIKWQEFAITKGNEVKLGVGVLKEMEEHLSKMKSGIPTWSIEKAK